MGIHTQAIGFSLTEALKAHVENEIEEALRPVHRFVISVTVRLSDVNGDRGGVDKRSRVVVELSGGGVVVAEAISDDLYVAIKKAAARIRRAALRSLKRPKARERKDPQRPGTFGEPVEVE